MPRKPPPEPPPDNCPDHRRTCTRCGHARKWVVAVCPKCRNPEFGVPAKVQRRLGLEDG